MLISLTVLSLSLLWILVVSILARTLLPNRFSSRPKLGLTIWFASLLSSVVAAAISLVSLGYAYFYSTSRVSTATFGESDWIANFLLSFVPWIALATFGIVLTLINLRIDAPTIQGRRLQENFQLAKKYLRDFEGVEVYELALPIYYALATEKEIFISKKLLDSLSASEIEAVLWHELGHIRGRHSALKSIARLVAVLTKPMDLSRVFQHSVDELCEKVADQFASKRVDPNVVQSVKRYFPVEQN